MADSQLINTLEQHDDQPSAFDAMAKLKPGEPYFLLLGRDRLAPPLVQQWANENRKRAFEEFDAGLIGKERYERELEKSRDAEARGWEMASFKAGDLAKRAAGEPTVKAYSGFDLDEETKRRDAIQAARGRAASAIHNAIGELAELVAVLEQGDPGQGHALLYAAAKDAQPELKWLADTVAVPRRTVNTASDMDYTRIDQ